MPASAEPCNSREGTATFCSGENPEQAGYQRSRSRMRADEAEQRRGLEWQRPRPAIKRPTASPPTRRRQVGYRHEQDGISAR